ncbi:MAG: RNA ligase family protein [bacterium]
MIEYHKIQTVFKRDPETNFKTLIDGEFALPEFHYLAYNDWVFTEKVDGTNIRVMFNGIGLKFGGKTDNAQIPTPLANKLNERFFPQIELFKETFHDSDVCLYGEGYGAKIQKGGNYRPDQDFVLFDVKIGEWWLQRDDVENIANVLGLDIVPIIGHGTLFNMISVVECGLSSKWNDNFIAEGIVARPATELKARNGSRIITKIKHKDFK